MESSFDNAGYKNLQKVTQQAVDNSDGLYYFVTRNGQIIADLLKYDRNGKLADFISGVKNLEGRVKALAEGLDDYEALVEEYLASGQIMMSGLDGVSYQMPLFSNIVIAPFSDSYPKYSSYQFMRSGKTFSDDYNDLYSFINTDVYQKHHMWETNLSMMADWDKLLIGIGCTVLNDTSGFDYYTDELLKTAMTALLDGLPNADSVVGGAKINNILGIKNSDKWLKEFFTLFKTFGTSKEGATIKEFLKTDEYKEWLSEAGENGEFVDEIIKEFAKEMDAKGLVQTVGKVGGDVLDALEWADVLYNIIGHSLADYSVQIGYLDTLKNSLLESGFAYGPVQKLIDELRVEYDDSVTYAIRSIVKKGVEDMEKGVIGSVVGQIPVLREANKMLKIGTTTVKAIYADTLSADKTLMGLQQFDLSLTRSYEHHLQMVKDGVANESDMEELDRLFQLIVTTKKKEYECMMTLSKGSNLYSEYETKLKELEKWVS